MRPKKHLGQHFLHDARVAARIVSALAPKPEDVVVEIGPGRGALTGLLAASGARLHVVEVDPDLAADLRCDYAANDAVTVHAQDALEFDFGAFVTGPARLRVIGNLPYNISTPLLFHLLAQARRLRDMLFMLQREVVERIAAAPGNRDYGRLSVMLQAYCRVQKLFTVGPGAFTPPPKVDSAVVRLVPYTTPPVTIDDHAAFARVVRAAFAQRRKTLRNALRDLVSAQDAETSGIDLGRRAETLSVAEFAALARVLAPQSAHQ